MNGSLFLSEEIKTPIKYQCDVLVCGGGFAGIAAALAASRLNKKVILVEKEYALGGLGTLGLVTIYLALCDGKGKQVSFGLAEELLRLSIKLGAENNNGKNWWGEESLSRTENDNRFEACFNPCLFAILAEQELIKSGVNILYGTYAVKTDVVDDKINAVIVENKSGRFGIKVKSAVDATGDADIAFFASAPTDTFKQGNILASWYYSYCKKNGYRLQPLGFCDVPEEQKTEDNKVELLNNRRFLGLDGQEISEYVILSHKVLIDDVKKRRKDTAEDYTPVNIPTIPQLRMTRKLVGEYVLSDKETHTYFEDSIGMVSDWRKRGPVYEVPFRTLYSEKIKNLVMAGRCTSVTEEMWDIMRVIPCCSVTGQAAGTAAALSDDFSTLDIKSLQNTLKENKVILHLKDLG